MKRQISPTFVAMGGMNGGSISNRLTNSHLIAKILALLMEKGMEWLSGFLRIMKILPFAVPCTH